MGTAYERQEIIYRNGSSQHHSGRFSVVYHHLLHLPRSDLRRRMTSCRQPLQVPPSPPTGSPIVAVTDLSSSLDCHLSPPLFFSLTLPPPDIFPPPLIFFRSSVLLPRQAPIHICPSFRRPSTPRILPCVFCPATCCRAESHFQFPPALKDGQREETKRERERESLLHSRLSSCQPCRCHISAAPL